MQFLVQIAVNLPGSMTGDEHAQTIAAEHRRGRELVEAGAIRAIWRVPGAIRNVAIWEAADATELHDLLSSLPVFRWASIDVTPLAEHPLSRPEG